MIVYSRHEHAAHYQDGAGGHDLERWNCADVGRLPNGDPKRPEGIPADAAYHCGYRAPDGSQRWLFTRRAPMTGTCPRCAPETRNENRNGNRI